MEQTSTQLHKKSRGAPPTMPNNKGRRYMQKFYTVSFYANNFLAHTSGERFFVMSDKMR